MKCFFLSKILSIVRKKHLFRGKVLENNSRKTQGELKYKTAVKLELSECQIWFLLELSIIDRVV